MDDREDEEEEFSFDEEPLVIHSSSTPQQYLSPFPSAFSHQPQSQPLSQSQSQFLPLSSSQSPQSLPFPMQAMPLNPALFAGGNVILVKIETDSFVRGLDVFSKMGTWCYFRFTPDGFSMTVSSCIIPKKKKVKEEAAVVEQLPASEYTFNGDVAPRYIFSLKKSDAQVLKYETCFRASGPQGLFTRIKDMKGGYISFQIRVTDRCDSDAGIEVCTKDACGSKAIPTDRVTETNRYPYIDQFSKWYAGERPAGKVIPKVLVGYLTTAKNTNCSSLKFSVNCKTKNMSISVSSGGKDVQSDLLDGGASNTEFIIDEDTVCFSKLILLTNNEWLARVTKISPKAVIQVYMSLDKPEAPLILATFVGTQGSAKYVVPNL